MQISSHILQVSFDEINGLQKDGVKKLVGAIIKHGFAFITEVCTLQMFYSWEEVQ